MKKALLITVFTLFWVASPFISHAQAPSRDGLLDYSHGEYTLNGVTLTPSQVFDLVGSEVYYETYEKALKQRKLGKTLFISGAAATAVGIAGIIVGALNCKPNEYDADGDRGVPYIIAGGALVAAGFSAVSAGVPFSIIGNRRLEWIASDYNRRNVYHSHLIIGPVRNGVGLALNF